MAINNDVDPETSEGLAMHFFGRTVVQVEPPATVIVETDSGYEYAKTDGWVKFATSFREKMLKDLKGAKLAVFLCICLHVGNGGKAFPGIDTIAKKTGYGRDEVMETVRELEAIPGLLQVDRKKGAKNIYRPAYVAYGKGNKPVGVTPTTFSKPVGVKGKTSSGGPDSKKREEDNKLFDAIASVCRVDPKTAGPSIGKIKKVLLQANPSYSADEVEKFGRLWWEWKDRKLPPTLWQLQERIGTVRDNNKKAPPITKSADGGLYV